MSAGRKNFITDFVENIQQEMAKNKEMKVCLCVVIEHLFDIISVVHFVDYFLFFLFMVALCNRADHYIFIRFLLLLSSFFFFPRLISAVGDWMSTILRHMVWS